jgi:Helix-turn-helix domain
MRTLPFAWSFRELLTMAELATYLKKPSGEAARKWAKRHAVPMSKCGREWRVDRRDVDRVMRQQTAVAVGQ